MTPEEIEFGKELFWNAAKEGKTGSECCEIIRNLLPKGNVTATTFGNYETDWGKENNSGKRKSSGGNHSNTTKFSLVSPETDAEYLNAVKNGDMETAQKMVDEAAKKAFPNTKVVDENGNPLRVYHGTNSDFWTFDILKAGKNGRTLGYGFYFAKNRSFSEMYGNRVIEAYIDIQKPLYDDKKTISFSQTKSFIKSLMDAEIETYKDDGLIWQDTFISNYVDTYSTSKNNAIQETASIVYDNNNNDADV